MINSRFVSCGHYLPKKILTNFDLEKMMDTSDEWIQSRTGIKQRYVAGEKESTAFMGKMASLEALEKSSLNTEDIDMIVVATTTPDNIFPSVATKIQHMLGAKNASAFDVQAVCAGFIYALSIADSFIKSGKVKNILVVGSERMTSLLDWNDRGTAVLFGDGAGAYLLSASESSKGIIATHLFSDGQCYDDLYVESSSKPFIKMNGPTVFKHGVKKMGESIETALLESSLKISDIDCFIPHQANKRIILGISEHFSIPISKVQISVDKYANTSAATIPLATHDAISSGRVNNGDLLLLTALGGGFSWGSAVLYYG